MNIHVPILKLGKSLLVPIEIELTDEMVEDLHIGILKEIEKTNAKGLIIDVSLIEVVDSFFARILINIGRAAKCLNCNTVIVGVTPEMALTLTKMGFEWRGVETALDVEQALDRIGR
ncbi:STAS domain-containing protein [candidate division WOR-3 bacterium]|nr:STAS domain-containing protein [candidate division WOR-3 bacterium]MCK4576560.1 STAS domain-containing protein [candidate division WOR-3 bacterium]